jgi:hypothetical protein
MLEPLPLSERRAQRVAPGGDLVALPADLLADDEDGPALGVEPDPAALCSHAPRSWLLTPRDIPTSLPHRRPLPGSGVQVGHGDNTSGARDSFLTPRRLRFKGKLVVRGRIELPT